MWNTRKTAGTPFLEDYESLLLRFGTDYSAVRQENIGPRQLCDFFGGTDYGCATMPNAQSLDFEGLQGRLLSSSYAPGPEHPQHQAMLAALAELFARHAAAGRVSLEYTTEFFWRRRS